METHAQKETTLFVVPVGAAIGGISRGDEGGGGGGGGGCGEEGRAAGLSVGLQISHEPGDGGGGR